MTFSDPIRVPARPTRRRLGRRAVPLLLLVPLCGLLGVGLSREDPPPAQEGVQPRRALPVEVRRLEEVTSFYRRRLHTGTVHARRTCEASFQQLGRIHAVYVEEGDHVERGQLLAALATEHLKARREVLQAQANQAQARLDELHAGPRPEAIASARADVRAFEAKLTYARQAHARIKGLEGSGASSQQEHEAALSQVEVVAAQLDAAQSRLDELVAGTRSERIAAQTAAVAELEAARRQLEAEFAHSRIVAPFAGRITARFADEGATVSPETPIVRIVEKGRLEAHIGLTTLAAARLQSGERRDLCIDGRQVGATVSAVLAELNPATRTQMVIFALDEGCTGAVPGQIARVEIEEQIETAGFWVPVAALMHGDRGLWSVYVTEPSSEDGTQIACRRDVEVLHVESHEALIRGTVSSGELLVTTGVHRLVPGQIVTIQDTGDYSLAADVD